MANDTYRTVFVAMAVPHVDGSGEPTPLGVFDTRDGAEAACWRYIVKQGLGAGQPTRVYRFRTNNDGFTSVFGEGIDDGE